MSKIYGVVYGLYNKEEFPKEIRYVGQTIQLPIRVRNHKDPKIHSHLPVSRWVTKMGPDNLGVEILAEADSAETLSQLEVELIKKYKTLKTSNPRGHNLTEGGEGATGFKHTPETLAKSLNNKTVIKGENHSRATFTNQEVKNIKSLWWDGEHPQTISLKYGTSREKVRNIVNGKTWKHIPFPQDRDKTPTQKVKRAPNKKKYVFTEEHKRNISLVRKGKIRGSMSPNATLNEDQVERIKSLFWKGETIKDISLREGLPEHLVGPVTRGESWTHVPFPEGILQTPQLDDKTRKWKASELEVRDIRRIFSLRLEGLGASRIVKEMNGKVSRSQVSNVIHRGDFSWVSDFVPKWGFSA